MTDTKTLPIPFGTYGHTPQYVLSKDGSIYTTAIGTMGKKRPWKSRVWRVTADNQSDIVLEVPAALALHVVNGQLLCVWVDPREGGYNAKIKVTPIAGYIPLDGHPSGAVVDINASQLALVNQRINTAQTSAGQAQGAADRLQGSVNNHTKTIADLQARITKLEQQGGGGNGSGLTKQQVEDIVWSKIWDINFLIRQGFRDGVSTIREVQDYLNDLTVFIKRIVGK